MGGQLWINSQVGHGSTFHFTASFGLDLGETATRRAGTQVALRNLPVLVVDDNATNRRILHDMLCHWHMQAIEVDGGRAALAMSAQARDQGGTVSSGVARCMHAGDGRFRRRDADQGRSYPG